MTEGYSGSDLTALARDAALGPIRGEDGFVFAVHRKKSKWMESKIVLCIYFTFGIIARNTLAFLINAFVNRASIVSGDCKLISALPIHPLPCWYELVCSLHAESRWPSFSTYASQLPLWSWNRIQGSWYVAWDLYFVNLSLTPSARIWAVVQWTLVTG